MKWSRLYWLVAFDVVRKARGQQGAAQVVHPGDADPLPVQVSPGALLGEEEFFGHRVVDDAQDEFTIPRAGQGDGENGKTVGEIRGPVQRIDRPPVLGGRLAHHTALLGPEAVPGKRAPQNGEDEPFRLPVRLGDQVAVALGPDAIDPAIEAPERAAASPRRPNGGV